ncbi:hypothetical protein ACFSYD_04865 [Paracoccus aerius]
MIAQGFMSPSQTPGVKTRNPGQKAAVVTLWRMGGSLFKIG